jgi:hypothetical protein
LACALLRGIVEGGGLDFHFIAYSCPPGTEGKRILQLRPQMRYTAIERHVIADINRDGFDDILIQNASVRGTG